MTESPERRVLALDLGDKRVGVAVSDPTATLASARGYLLRRYPQDEKWLQELKILIEKEEISEIIVGLPLQMSGEEGTAVEEVKRLVAWIQTFVTVPITFRDERYTSVRAEEILVGRDVRREKRKKLRDGLAAELLLQQYLDEQKGGD